MAAVAALAKQLRAGALTPLLPLSHAIMRQSRAELDEEVYLSASISCRGTVARASRWVPRLYLGHNAKGSHNTSGSLGVQATLVNAVHICYSLGSALA